MMKKIGRGLLIVFCTFSIRCMEQIEKKLTPLEIAQCASIARALDDHSFTDRGEKGPSVSGKKNCKNIVITKVADSGLYALVRDYPELWGSDKLEEFLKQYDKTKAVTNVYSKYIHIKNIVNYFLEREKTRHASQLTEIEQRLHTAGSKLKLSFGDDDYSEIEQPRKGDKEIISSKDGLDEKIQNHRKSVSGHVKKMESFDKADEQIKHQQELKERSLYSFIAGMITCVVIYKGFFILYSYLKKKKRFF